MKNFDELMKDLGIEEKEEFTNEELEEKIGKCLRLIEEIRIKEEAWNIRFIKFCYRLNKMVFKKCSIEELIDYFNLKKDKIFCDIEFLD